MEPNVQYTEGQRMTVQLSRPDSTQSWGFRLQGGADFSTPLSLQVVQPNSIAENFGLEAGDGILHINNVASDGLSHEQAKMEIIKSGNQITLGIIRGAVKVWKPLVTPMSELRPTQLNTITTATGDEITPVQKTSLEMKHPEPLKIEAFNRSARGFQSGGGAPDSPKKAVPNVVHAQFNSPIGMYSPENLADSYHMQTQGIQSQMANLDVGNKPVGATMSGTYQDVRYPAGDSGVPGDDTNSKGYTNTAQSRTFLMLQDELDRQKHAEQSGDVETTPACNKEAEDQENKTDTNQNDIPPHMEVGPSGPAGFKSVSAPVYKPPDPAKQAKQESHRCGECDMLVTGVFVRVKGIPYHVNCFKCASCQVNLKQKGYFVIDGKLYCDIHAKRVAQPPGSNMVATAVYR